MSNEFKVKHGLIVGGDVTIDGVLNATAKSFIIDHPTQSGKKLKYGSLEGPEHGVYTRGRVEGYLIELPEYWTKLVDENTITVQLTSIGSPQNVFISEIKNNCVFIDSNSGVPNVYYFIQAERKDIQFINE